MARPLRRCPGGLVYHVLNRASGRRAMFLKEGDYAAFEGVLGEGLRRRAGAVELFCYCPMPNHWHQVVRPAGDEDLSGFVRWVSVTHAQQWHAHYETRGTGHLYQGRFKSFPVESDEHLLTVCRYVERNALRANLVTRAEAWRWCSLWRRVQGREEGMLSAWPVEEPVDWMALVNRPQGPEEEGALREAIRKGRPFGSEEFCAWTREALGLEGAFRERGRPRRKRGEGNDS